MDDNILGAPAPGSQVDYRPALEGFGSDKVVAVFNPLPKDFRVQYARAIAENPRLSQGAQVAKDRAGLDLSKEQGLQANAVQFHILKAGKTENLPGDIAQVAVRQLITTILQIRHKGRSSNMVADPQSRADVEKEVVVKTTDNVTFFNERQEPSPESSPEEAETVPDPPAGQGVSYQPAKN